MNNSRHIEKKKVFFPFYRFQGTSREVGRQYGEACRELIIKHLFLVKERLESKVKIPSQAALDATLLKYRQYVQKYYQGFDEEVVGMSEGARISLADAYLLQLRAEVYIDFNANDECTTFAVLSEATSNNIPLIGQNADLPGLYKEISVVAEFVIEDRPSCLMLVPAGQISYIGINDVGMGVFANFLTSDDWRPGFPRYMFSKLALTKSSIEEAKETIRGLHRASSRNLIMMDSIGALDMETMPTRDCCIEPQDGILAHSNHFIGSEILDEERSTGANLLNSKERLRRMKELLYEHHGSLNVDVMQTILRDRKTYPDTLCRKPGDFGTDSITFASLIAEPSEGRLWIAIGPPDEYEYKCYTFGAKN